MWSASTSAGLGWGGVGRGAGQAGVNSSERQGFPRAPCHRVGCGYRPRCEQWLACIGGDGGGGGGGGGMVGMLVRTRRTSNWGGARSTGAVAGSWRGHPWVCSCRRPCPQSDPHMPHRTSHISMPYITLVIMHTRSTPPLHLCTPQPLNPQPPPHPTPPHPTATPHRRRTRTAVASWTLTSSATSWAPTWGT